MEAKRALPLRREEPDGIFDVNRHRQSVVGLATTADFGILRGPANDDETVTAA
jgi:hypothetical protein